VAKKPELLKTLENEEGLARQRQERARRADALLRNEMLNQAFEDVRKKLYHEFCTAKYPDNETRLRAEVGADMLNRVMREVYGHIQSGKVADAALTKIDLERRFLRR
jgi:hypothetical protein